MCKILLVDDCPDTLYYMQMLFKEESSYELITAQSGKEAIALAKSEQPDVILLDVVMPEMNGFETCEVLKSDESTKRIPIMFISAYDSDEAEAKSFSIGGYALIKKPVPMKFILNIVEDCLLHHKVMKDLRVLSQSK